MKRFALYVLAVLALGAILYAQTTVYEAGVYKVVDGTATVTSPSIVQATNAVSTTALAALTGLDGKVLTRRIQNVGTNAVYYRLGGAVALTNYHGIIACGTAALDGNGGIVDLSNWTGTVTVMTSASTSHVATLQFYR